MRRSAVTTPPRFAASPRAVSAPSSASPGTRPFTRPPGRRRASRRTCAQPAQVRLEALRLPGGLVNGLVPGLALEGALTARGDAAKRGGVVTADLRIDAGGGWVEVAAAH